MLEDGADVDTTKKEGTRPRFRLSPFGSERILRRDCSRRRDSCSRQDRRGEDRGRG